jgi:Fe-S cluster assembly protein SufD
MITQVSNSLYQQLRTTFEESLPKTDGPIEHLRKAAFERFTTEGLPTAKLEEWKNTGIQSVLNENFVLNSDLPGRSVTIDKALIEGVDAYKIVLVNGVFRKDLSDVPSEKGVEILATADALDHAVFQVHFAQYADKSDNPFVRVNTALAKDGFFIHIADNVQLIKPIHVIHVSVTNSSEFFQGRNLIVLGKNAEVEVLESFITENGSEESLSNVVTEIVLDINAKMEHYYIQIAGEQSKFLNHTEVIQLKHSLYNNYNCTFPGSSFIRNNINVRLEAESVESHLYGINLTSAKQLVDNHTVVDHIKPHCESYEWYKNIIQEESTVIFNGKIFVREDAQKTNAFQQNNNMLMGADATIFTKPQLEIFADDVKCSHGCTIGQFNEEALFYLRTRGIGAEQARVLMVHAFAFDVTERFKDENIKNYVNNLIEQGLKIESGN